MDEFMVKRAADQMTHDYEKVMPLIRKMERDINSLTTEELFMLKIYLQMRASWLMHLNQAINTPTKKSRKFWRK